MPCGLRRRARRGGSMAGLDRLGFVGGRRRSCPASPRPSRGRAWRGRCRRSAAGTSGRRPSIATLPSLDAAQDAAEVLALAGRRSGAAPRAGSSLRCPTKCAKCAGGPQRAVDARRADLEAVRLRDRILDVEHGRQLARQVLAVGQVDALARGPASDPGARRAGGRPRRATPTRPGRAGSADRRARNPAAWQTGSTIEIRRC